MYYFADLQHGRFFVPAIMEQDLHVWSKAALKFGLLEDLVAEGGARAVTVYGCMSISSCASKVVLGCLATTIWTAIRGGG